MIERGSDAKAKLISTHLTHNNLALDIKTMGQFLSKAGPVLDILPTDGMPFVKGA